MGWNIEGHYVETCNCDFLCPCITSNATAKPTEGECKAALAFQIENGQKDGLKLSGLSFVVLLYSPGPMAEGNLKVGLIIDEHADDNQTEAIKQITSGSEGGPMEFFEPLVTEFAGIEKRPIKFEGEGLNFSVSAGELVNQSIEGLPGADEEAGDPIYLENVPHPANTKLALAKATNSEFHAFGINWEDSTGTRNGHFQRFAWAA